MGYAKGIMLYGDHVKEFGGLVDIPSGVDFIIGVAADGFKIEKGFTGHVQEAYNANIPFLGKIDVNIDVYGNAFSMANPIWPSFENDPHMKLLIPFFKVCKIHGVVLDIRNSNGAEVWIPFVAKHLRELILNNFKVPVYILADNDLTTKYPSGIMENFLATETMLSTYYKVVGADNGGTIIDPKGSPKPNWNGVKFWWYGSQSFDFLMGTKSSFAPILQYRAPKETLYNELGFTPREEYPPDVGNTEEPNYSSEDLERIEQKIDDLASYIKSHII